MDGDSRVSIGRDAMGNVITTGDKNVVEAHMTASTALEAQMEARRKAAGR